MRFLVRFIKWSSFTLFFLIATLLLIGTTRIDVKIYSYFKYLSIKFNTKEDEIPMGTSQAGRDFYGRMNFIYRGKLPKPDQRGKIYVKDDCNSSANETHIPHHFIICLPERGIYQISKFTHIEIRKIGKDAYYITGGVDDYY